MSDTAPETPDFEAKLEALAAEGFHLVFSGVERYIIEKVDHVGTQSFEGKTLSEVIGYVEEKLASHPGSSVEVISRSDGIHESQDLLATQAGKPAPSEGQSGTTPSARAEAVDPQFEATRDNLENTGAGPNVAAPDAAEPGTPESAAVTDTAPVAPAPEEEAPAEDASEPAEEAAPAVDTSGTIASEPGQVATGPIGTEADTPAPAAAPLPEGAVES